MKGRQAMAKIFVSYSHHQGDWVLNRLAPCLKAGGAEVLIDVERFKFGKALIGQMDATQDQAEIHMLILSEDYLRSDYCLHEMNRALALDPDFERGIVIPVMRKTCTLPDTVKRPNPLYADLRQDRQPKPWATLLEQCGAVLGTSVPDWLAARNDIVRYLKRGQSVNLVVDNGVDWRPLLNHIASDHLVTLARVDLQDPATASRRGLLAEILSHLGLKTQVPPEPEDLVTFRHTLLDASPSTFHLALTHCDMVPYSYKNDINLFAALRHLIMDKRKLVLLAQSRKPFAALLPQDHPLSEIDLKTVQLQAYP